MYKQNKAFTLVELIVVITILAILGTIAFISLQGYSKDTRNSVRISDMSNINKTLGIKMVTVGKVPLPDNYVEITASGTVLNYQGEAGERVLEVLGIFNGGKDPKDDTYYTYSTNTNRIKYQLLGFLEGDAIANNALLGNTFAVTDLSERQITSKGDELGIVLDSVTNVPVTTTVDVVNTVDTYKITFSDESVIEGPGTTLFSNIYNRNDDLLNNKELASLDDSLVGYWDMETLTGTLLKDLSQYGHDGTAIGGLVIGGIEGNGKTGKAINFGGNNDHIDIGKSSLLSFEKTDAFTISFWIKGDYDSTKYFSVINKLTTQSGKAGWRILRNLNSSKLNFTLTHDHGNGDILVSIDGAFDDQWHNVLFSYDGNGVSGGMKGYLDGVLKTSGGGGNLISTTIDDTSVFIGGNWGFLQDTIIDEVRIYSRALSGDEVDALHNSTK